MGVLAALGSAVCLGAYILLTQRVGDEVTGITGLADALAKTEVYGFLPNWEIGNADTLDLSQLTTLAVILIMSGATFGDFALEGPVWRLFALIGDASYSIYLLHSAPIRAALAVSQRVSLDFASAPWLYVAGSLLGAIVLGIVAYYACERPVTRYLRRLLKPRKLAQASAV